jgi:hypothetical protein
MFLNVEDVYRYDTSQIFQLAIAGKDQRAMNFGENSGTSASGEIGRSYGSLPTLELALALEKYRSRAITGYIGFLDPDHIQSTCTDMEALLKTRCGGLLEVHRSSLNSEIRPASSVEYLHLTVRDFFYKPEARKILEERSPTGFDPNIVLLKSCILQYKALSDGNQTYVISRRSITDRALIYAGRVDKETLIPIGEDVPATGDSPSELTVLLRELHRVAIHSPYLNLPVLCSTTVPRCSVCGNPMRTSPIYSRNI